MLRSASDSKRPKLDHVEVQEEEQIYHDRQPAGQESDLQQPHNVYTCLSDAARSNLEEPNTAEHDRHASVSTAAQAIHRDACNAMKRHCAAVKHRFSRQRRTVRKRG